MDRFGRKGKPDPCAGAAAGNTVKVAVAVEEVAAAAVAAAAVAVTHPSASATLLSANGLEQAAAWIVGL